MGEHRAKLERGGGILSAQNSKLFLKYVKYWHLRTVLSNSGISGKKSIDKRIASKLGRVYLILEK